MRAFVFAPDNTYLGRFDFASFDVLEAAVRSFLYGRTDAPNGSYVQAEGRKWVIAKILPSVEMLEVSPDFQTRGAWPSGMDLDEVLRMDRIQLSESDKKAAEKRFEEFKVKKEKELSLLWRMFRVSAVLFGLVYISVKIDAMEPIRRAHPLNLGHGQSIITSLFGLAYSIVAPIAGIGSVVFLIGLPFGIIGLKLSKALTKQDRFEREILIELQNKERERLLSASKGPGALLIFSNKCPNCNGRGRWEDRDIFYGLTTVTPRNCDKCGGTGRGYYISGGSETKQFYRDLETEYQSVRSSKTVPRGSDLLALLKWERTLALRWAEGFGTARAKRWFENEWSFMDRALEGPELVDMQQSSVLTELS